MKNILLISCSPKTSGSHSSTFAHEFVDRLKQSLGSTKVVHRDLSNAPIPHVSSQHTLASEKHESVLAHAEQEALKLSNTLIEELEATDILIIATPMHNYNVPSVLKAWIDHVVRAHRTIKLTPQGKIGLIGDKRTYIIVSSGGHHTNQLAWQPDFLTPYLTEILHTVGITTVEFIYLEAMNHGPEAIELAVETARKRVEVLFSKLRSSEVLI